MQLEKVSKMLFTMVWGKVKGEGWTMCDVWRGNWGGGVVGEG